MKLNTFTEAERDLLIDELKTRIGHYEGQVHLYKTDIEINPHNLKYTKVHLENLRDGLSHSKKYITLLNNLIKKIMNG